MLLRELRMRPEWGQLLGELQALSPPLRPYKTSDKGTVEEAGANWIYCSGLQAGYSRVLNLLAPNTSADDSS